LATDETTIGRHVYLQDIPFNKTLLQADSNSNRAPALRKSLFWTMTVLAAYAPQ